MDSDWTDGDIDAAVWIDGHEQHLTNQRTIFGGFQFVRPWLLESNHPRRCLFVRTLTTTSFVARLSVCCQGCEFSYIFASISQGQSYGL
jgi:hypothetical protein